jgi:hypothetical protein
MAMLLGPANGSIMVRHVLDVREGALPSNHTISMLSLFPRIRYKHSKNKMLRVLQMTVSFFPVVIFSGRSWCSYFDTYDRKKILPEKKVQSIVWPSMFFGGFKLQPEKF